MEHSQPGMGNGHSRHMLIMVLCCVIPMAAIVAIGVFGIPLTGVLRYAITLICPIGFVLMMLMMRGDHSHETHAGQSDAGSQEKSASCH